jgi:hypothetical protein
MKIRERLFLSQVSYHPFQDDYHDDDENADVDEKNETFRQIEN